MKTLHHLLNFSENLKVFKNKTFSKKQKKEGGKEGREGEREGGKKGMKQRKRKQIKEKKKKGLYLKSQAWSMVQSGLWFKSVSTRSLCSRKKMSICLFIMPAT